MTFDTQKFYSSRDIVFYEEVFPFSTSVPSPLFPTEDRVSSCPQDNGAACDGPVFDQFRHDSTPTTSQPTEHSTNSQPQGQRRS